jgi:predicted alpha-1,2-mannosidase
MASRCGRRAGAGAAALWLLAAAPGVAAAAGDPLRVVDPLVGTAAGAPDFGTGGGAGATFPGAVVPFGMVQFSPDTLPGTTNFAGGYSFGDRALRGFGLTHFSGAGCALFQDVPFLPTVTPVGRSPAAPGSSDLRPEYVPRFGHAREHAAPGSYRVVLDPGTARAIGGELSATTRTGAGRFTYPPTRLATMLINAGGSAMANGEATVRVDPARREVAGTAESGRFCFQPARYRVYFAARFDRRFVAYGTWRRQAVARASRHATDRSPNPTNYKPIPGGPPALPGNPSTTAQAGAYVTFDARRRPTVGLRVGVSFTSVAGARANLRAEAAGRSFAAIRRAAQARWRRALGRVTIGGGRRADRTTFYTALYHALLHPNVISDADGRYPGMDGRVHRARGFAKHGNLSGWDVYRGQQQLVAMLDPARAAAIVRSLLADARESGCLPRWPVIAAQTNVMVGDPSAAIIASAHALGVHGFDARAALRAAVRGATRRCHTANGDYTQREGLAEYLRLGYVPQDLDVDAAAHTTTARDRPWGAAATTLEYALADAAIAQLAARLGARRTAAAFRRRAAGWRRLVEPRLRTVVPRFADGRFLERFDPAGGAGFVEGNGAQYAWLVPHDPAGLAASMGGRGAARARLDRFFARLNAGSHEPFAFMGNEPGLGTPWLYDWLGAPWKTQRVVRRALLELYRPTPGGLPGNDDGGTLSAWWVLGALGLYPAVPGSDVLALGSPLFERATLRLGGARVTIAAPGAARGRPYVRALRLGGRGWTRPWLRFAALRRARRLDVTVGATPNRRWGAAPADAPPSLGPSPSRAGAAGRAR